MSGIKPPTEHGIDSLPLTPEAMAAAVRAAEAAGMSVEDWLTRVILAGAYRASTPARRAAAEASNPFSPLRLAHPEWGAALTGSAKVREALARLAKREAERREGKAERG